MTAHSKHLCEGRCSVDVVVDDKDLALDRGTGRAIARRFYLASAHSIGTSGRHTVNSLPSPAPSLCGLDGAALQSHELPRQRRVRCPIRRCL